MILVHNVHKFLIESGGFTWEGILKGTFEEECPADDLSNSLSSIISNDNGDKTVIQTAEELQLALSSLKQVIYAYKIRY